MAREEGGPRRRGRALRLQPAARCPCHLGMAHIEEKGGGKGRNIELNIVPFIDLMSCLTAFLLVTAVWVNTANLPVEPVGKNRNGGDPCAEEDCGVKLSVLVDQDEIWIGLSRLNEFQRIARGSDGKYNFDELEARLREHKASAFFKDSSAIEIAAVSTSQSPVRYQTLVSTMDIAVKVGFVDVGLTDPDGLSARPVL
ncbi:MAG TPA: biopolymer transporter ExbD [Kofleriaceae bacterium]|nr:biopolymer transporter ExbD [Kofleriaceae bacterium]